MPEPRTWNLFACDDEGRLFRFGNAKKLKYSSGKYPVVEVILTEDSEGPLLGWLDTDADEVTLIQPKHIFNIQFPDGYQEKERVGQGKAIPLRFERK